MPEFTTTSDDSTINVVTALPETVEEVLAADDTRIIIQNDGEKLVEPPATAVEVSRPRVVDTSEEYRQLRFRVSITVGRDTDDDTDTERE